MCSKTTRSSPRNRSKRRKPNPKPLRKTRTKPKTRSLLKDLSPAPAAATAGSPESTDSTRQTPLADHHLLEDKDDNNVAYLLDDTDTSATLNGLIWSSSGGGGGGGGVVSSEEDSLCPSLAYYHEEGRRTNDSGTNNSATRSSLMLERSALRGAGNSERDVKEERWVCYEEVTSCVPEYGTKNGLVLSLKLDYEEIMNAWSGKGPLYVDQAVPDVLNDDDALQHDISNAFSGVGNVPLLRVPEDGSSVMDGEKVRTLGPREAGVLRYKKKRQNRLFSKRIRYEVRKLNAEKRPRMKGRFVKRS